LAGYFYPAVNIGRYEMNSSSLKRVVLALIIFMTIASYAFGQHWNTPDATGSDHTLVICGSLFNDIQLSSDDEIAVFTNDMILAGHVLCDDTGIFGMAARGDDPTTEDIIEGFVTDEAFAFKFWIESESIEIEATATFNSGPQVFVSDGISNLSLLANSSNVSETDLSENIRPILKAYPSPFNSSITISLDDGGVTKLLKIYNINGSLVNELTLNSQSTVWDGTNFSGAKVSSGIYFCRLSGDSQMNGLRIIKLD
jgi:Secretion system C-terminal sorting domain